MKVVSKKDRSLNWGIVGIGQAGSRIAETFYKYGYEACVFNTATQDLENINLPDNRKVFLPFSLGGAGKELQNGKQAVEKNSELIINKLNDIFNENNEMILICTSGGGGSGSGGLISMINLTSTLGKPIGVIYVLPMDSEDSLSKHNTIYTLSELTKMVSSDIVSTFVIADNSKIEVIYPGLSKAEFWNTANNAIVEPLHLFNSLSSQATKYDSLDPMDFGRLLTNGDCTIYGMLEVENYQETTAIAEAIVDNLISGLLVDDFDLKETRFGGFIVLGNSEVLSNLPAVNINYASHMISDLCNSPSLVSGVYEFPLDKNVVRVYTLLSGLGLPKKRIESLKNDADEKMNILKQKENTRSDRMSVDYKPGTSAQTITQEVHRMIQQKKSGFGVLTNNTGKVVDRRRR